MLHRVAPVGVLGAAAEGADLDGVGGAGGEAVHGEVARIGVDAAALVRAGGAARADGGVTQFVAVGVGDGGDLREELAGVAIEDVGDGGGGQGGLRAVHAHGVEAAGEQHGQVVAVPFLDVAGELAEQVNDDGALVVLVRGVGGAAYFGGGDGQAEGGERRIEDNLRDGRVGIGGVAEEVGADGAAGFFEGVVGHVAEAEEDAELGHFFGCGLGLDEAVVGQAGHVPCERVALGVLPVPGGRGRWHGGWVAG